MACIVLHNLAVKLRLPVPDEDDHPADDDNDGNDGNNEGGVPTVTGRAKRDTVATKFQRVQTFSKSYYVINMFYLNYKCTFVELSSATVGTDTLTHITG